MRKRKKTISKNMIEVLDYHTSRTYRKNGKRVKKKSITPEAMKTKKDIQNFTRRLNRRYKKLGKELKYIYIAEGKTRIHFHMIINNAELYSDELNELWPHGMHKLMLYQGRAEDAVRLASYFVKEKRSACYSEKEDA